MNKKYVIRLTDEERLELRALVSRGKQAVWRQTRAWVLLQADCGLNGPAWTDERISEAYGVSVVTIYRVRQLFVEEGFAKVLRRKPLSRPRPRRLDGDQEARLIALACSQPPAGRCRWTSKIAFRGLWHYRTGLLVGEAAASWATSTTIRPKP